MSEKNQQQQTAKQKQVRKVCPLASYTSAEGGDYDWCAEIYCGWWDSEHQQCSIISLKNTLNKIFQCLNDIFLEMPKAV
jgi:hypothetical protein